MNHPAPSISAVLFDMDNTLFDFIDAKIRSCDAVTAHIGRDDGWELLGYFIKNGKGIETLENIEDYLRDRNAFDEETFNDCCEIYERVKIDNIDCYPGMKDALMEIRDLGVKMGILTDADRLNTERRLARTDLARFFDAVITYEDTGRKKPDHEPFIYAVQEMDVRPCDTVFIGDSMRRDLTPARELGMITIHARYGDYNYEKWEWEPDFTAWKAEDIVEIVSKIKQSDQEGA